MHVTALCTKPVSLCDSSSGANLTAPNQRKQQGCIQMTATVGPEIMFDRGIHIQNSRYMNKPNKGAINGNHHKQGIMVAVYISSGMRSTW